MNYLHSRFSPHSSCSKLFWSSLLWAKNILPTVGTFSTWSSSWPACSTSAWRVLTVSRWWEEWDWWDVWHHKEQFPPAVKSKNTFISTFLLIFETIKVYLEGSAVIISLNDWLRILFLQMRVLKLAQSWTTMKVLLSIIISTLGALGNLTFILLIVIYIFAVLGMQLFGKDYTTENFYPDPIPRLEIRKNYWSLIVSLNLKYFRWNFTDFFHSFMMIFRILCGEWIEPLWDCMRVQTKSVRVVVSELSDHWSMLHRRATRAPV